MNSFEPPGMAFAYAIADHELHSNTPLILARAYRINRPPLASPQPATPIQGASVSVRADGLVAEARRNVRCNYHRGGVRIQVSGIGDFLVDTGAGAIHYTAVRLSPEDRHLVEQVLFGPALIIALAYRSVFLLHAGAVRVGDGATAFCAESGVGKSTLAAFSGPSWQPIADDLLPVRIAAGAPEALPRFPQLKWPDDTQYPLRSPPRLPLRSVFLLAPLPPETSDDRVELEPLDTRESALALIRHGVSSRLFSQPLLKLQMQFCAEASAALPVFRLRYPKRVSILPRLRETIQNLTDR